MGSGAGKPVVTPAATQAYTFCYTGGAGPSSDRQAGQTSRGGEGGVTRETQTGGVQQVNPLEPGGSGDNNSRPSSQQSNYGEAVDENSNMVCEACAASFHVFKRKYRCTDCDRYYCSNCFIKDPRRYCSACSAVSQSPTRTELLTLKIKDLRLYLNTHSVSTQSCREKDDLVDLVLQYVQAHPNPPTRTNTSRATSSTSSNRNSQQQQRSRTNQQRQQQQQNAGQRVTQRLEEVVNDLFANLANAARESSTDLPSFAPNSTSDATESVERPQSRQAWTSRHTASTTVSNTEPPQQTQQTEQTNERGPSEESEQTPVQPMRKRGSLSDIDEAGGIESLSIKQLKEILTANFVDYKGCVERWELQERVKRLYEEKQQRKKKEEDKTKDSTKVDGEAELDEDESTLCKICMDADIDCVLLECGHMVTCTSCGKRMNECPICRQYVIRAVHIFRA